MNDMRVCWHCGNRFLPDPPYATICGDGWEDERIDFDDEQHKNIFRACHDLRNHEYTENDKRLIASCFFPWFAETIMPAMEVKQFQRLLEKMTKQMEGV
jgi:hypothetical protein